MQQVLKLFSGRNNSLVFGFSNSLSYGLEESREWRALISWVLGQQMLKNAEHFCQQDFFFSFLNHHYGFRTYLEILNFLLSDVILRVVSACRILHYHNSLANSYQILRWIMSKLASREVLGKIIVFVLEFGSLKVALYQIIHILKNENYHQLFSSFAFCFSFCFIYCKCLLVITYMPF